MLSYEPHANKNPISTRVSIDPALRWDGTSFGAKSPAPRLVFPSNLMSPDFVDRPTISFQCRDKSQEGGPPITIVLPCPGGISINDGASYATVDLGIIGAAASAVMKGVNAGTAAFAEDGTAGAAGMGVIDSIIDQAKKASTTELARGGLQKLGLGETANFATRQVTNPRSNTAFTSNTIRSFSFTFKLVANSAAEAKVAKKIHDTFRRLVYAQRTGVLSLAYPDLWIIRFLSGEKGENPYIPKIHKCYLTAVSSTFNATSNTWRKDTAPFEIDIGVQFQELKVLTQEDIKELEKDTPDRNSINDVQEVAKLAEKAAQATANALLNKGNVVDNLFQGD